MVSTEIKTESEEALDPGRKKYGRLERMFREGYLALSIYKNVYEFKTFYDIVISRKVKKPEGQVYVRGANLKPSDFSDLEVLLKATQEYLKCIGVIKS